MSVILAVADGLSDAIGLMVLVGAVGFCAVILPDVWRGR